MPTSPRVRPRAKTKTFTGCWTCRKRKVKCDETRPNCKQCVSQGLSCAGYNARLQWLTPDTGSGTSMPTTYARTGSSLRRYMPCGEPERILDDHELDCNLEQIESESPAPGIPTTKHGPFSVYRLQSPNEASQREGLQPTQKLVDMIPDTNTDLDLIPWLTDDISEAANGVWPEISQPPLSNARATISHSSQSSFEAVPTELSTSMISAPAQSTINIDQTPVTFVEETRSRAKTGDQTSHASPDQYLGYYVVDPFRISADVRCLLYHYINHVVDLMTAVTTPKGPWKSVYLPRALEGSGELAVLGSTSHARGALFHALLSISAYNLASHYTLATQELQAQNWCGIALRCRARAVTCLKACLESNCPLPKRGKYKEVLAAMLSMITIDVCSGETRSSKWHLEGLESFIRMSWRKSKGGYSGKAQALHRVYVYLRVMRESTDLFCKPTTTTAEPLPHNLSWLSEPLCFLDKIDPTKDWLQGSSRSCAKLDLSACEFVYGIPLELLVLTSKTTGLIQRKRRFSREYPASVMPQMISTMCDELETELLNWPVDLVVSAISTLPVAEESRLLIEHQTRAFHKAIIIYFSQLVRSIHRRHLQPYTEEIIGHLEAIEAIKRKDNLATGCILWPGFIGAAEAIDKQLQSRYLQWFGSIRFYGLGAYEKAQKVVLEVWEGQNSGKCPPNNNWSAIIESKDIRLMLT